MSDLVPCRSLSTFFILRAAPDQPSNGTHGKANEAAKLLEMVTKKPLGNLGQLQNAIFPGL